MSHLHIKHPYIDFLPAAANRLQLATQEVTCLAFTALSGVYCGKETVLKFFFGEEKWKIFHRELEFYAKGMEHGLPIPNLLSYSAHTEEIPFIVCEKANGVNLQAASSSMTQENKQEIYQQLQNLLSQIHQISHSSAQCRQAKWADMLQTETDLGLQYLSERNLLSDKSYCCLHHFLETCLNDPLFSAQPSVLLHGDFCEKNLLVVQTSRGWKLSALIDFGCSCYGDPLFDSVRSASMFHRLCPTNPLAFPKHLEARLFVYQLCDYLMYIKNVFSINDSGFFPFFLGKIFQYPDCHEEYIYQKMKQYEEEIVTLPISWSLSSPH